MASLPLSVSEPPAPTPRSRPDSPARTQAGQARGRGGATEGLARGVGGVGSIPTRFPCPPSIPCGRVSRPRPAYRERNIHRPLARLVCLVLPCVSLFAQ